MSERIIELIVSKQPGVLSRLSLELRRSGLSLEGQEFSEIVGSSRRLRLYLGKTGPLGPDFKSRVEAVPGVESFESLVEPPPSKEVLQGRLREAFLAIQKGEDQIRVVVHFEPHLSTDLRNSCLVGLGRKVGNAMYKRDFAFGSPLGLAATMERVAVPSLSKFLPVKLLSSHQVEIQPCPLCDEMASSCAYVGGVLTGLLELAPKTATVQVSEVVCGHGTASRRCVFAVSA